VDNLTGDGDSGLQFLCMITQRIVSEVPPARSGHREEPSRHFGYNPLRYLLLWVRTPADLLISFHLFRLDSPPLTRLDGMAYLSTHSTGSKQSGARLVGSPE
jgi:hypothetical protein